MCPPAHFHGTMLAKDTLIVTYEKTRDDARPCPSHR
jgi:hypothetical protein